MPTQFLTGASAAAGIAAINSIGNLGGFFGPTIIGWSKTVSGGYEGGLIAVGTLLVVSALLVLTLKHLAGDATRASSGSQHS